MSESAYLYAVGAGVFISLVIFAILIYTILLKFSTTLGVRDKEFNLVRWSNVSKPSLGGIGFYIIFLLSIALYAVFFESDHIFKDKALLGIIFAASLAFLMGLADDAYNTKPFLKFGVQLLCGAILIGTGTFIDISEVYWVNYLLTIVWVIGIMNSINMLDNMDGITSIVSLSIFFGMLLLVISAGWYSNLFFILIIGLMAVLCGFLYYNWHPSRMFMGDTGSQFLGFILAAFAIIFFWNGKASHFEEGWRNMAVVLLAFIMPITDTTFVVIQRIKRGQSPFVGGKDHTTHHLSYAGISDSQVGFIFMAMSLISVLAILFLHMAPEYLNPAFAIGTFIYFIFVLILFFILAQHNKKNGKET
jgi:UDP-GlcNAc:undecaprenyl-phosphate/decaprenyl-phosphate GlcNAc-1-phosphate transferase